MQLLHLPEIAPGLSAPGMTLRAWQRSDAASVLRLADDDETRRWSPSLRELRNLTDAEAWILGRLERRTDWAAWDLQSGELVGRVGLHHHDPEVRAAEIGYQVMPGFRRRGVAKAMVEAVVDYAFAPVPDGLDLVRVNLQHAVGNEASCRTALACGFSAEGLIRSVIPAGDDRFDDAHQHGRLAGDPAGPLPIESEHGGSGSTGASRAAVTPTELVAGRLQLLVPDPDRDAADVVAACADPEIARWNAGPTDLAAGRAWCMRRADWSDGTHASWIVREATGGALVGAVSINQVIAAQLACDIGYWVARAARGQGVASGSVAAATRFGFEAMGLRRIQLYHAVENVASCRTATSAGYAQEGLLRQSFRYGDGEFHDEHMHARLVTDPTPGLSRPPGA